MSYLWRYTDAAGEQVAGPQESFAEQVDAEDWLSGSWADLLDAGVDAVTLLDGDTEVYGPMSLHAAE